MKESVNQKTSPSYSEITFMDAREIHGVAHGFHSNGGIARIIRFDGVNDSGFTEEQYDNVNMAIAKAIKQLPEREITIQWVLKRRPAQNIIDITKEPNAAIHLKERNAYLHALQKNGELLENIRYLVIICNPDHREEGIVESLRRKINEFKEIFSGVEKDAVNDRFDFSHTMDRIRKLDNAAKVLAQSFKLVGCRHRNVETRDEYINLLYEYFNPEKSKLVKLKLPETVEGGIRRKLVSGRPQQLDRFFLSDDTFNRVYALDDLSMDVEVFGKSMKRLLDAPFAFTYIVSLKAMEREEIRDKVNKRILMARVMENMQNENNKNNPDLQAIKEVNEATSINERLLEQQNKACQCSFYLVYQENIHKIDQKCESRHMKIADYIFELDQMLYQQYFSEIAQSEWLAMPGGWENFCRLAPGMVNLNSLTSKNWMQLPNDIAYLLPLYDVVRRDLRHTGTNHYYTDNLGYIPFELYDPILNSWNGLIHGDLGSGKSVFLNVMISSLDSTKMITGKNPVVRIMDYGGVAGSFYKQAKAKDGVVLNFATGKKDGIQLMEIPEFQMFPTIRKTQELIAILRKYVEGTNGDISELISQYYEYCYSLEGKLKKSNRLFFLEKTFKISPEVAEEINELFVLKPGEAVPNSDYALYLQSCIEIIMSPDPKEITVDYERDTLMNIVFQVYENTPDRFPFLYDLYLFLCEMNGEDHNLCQRLKRFTREGQFRQFDRATSVDLSNDFILFDMFGLDDKPKLKNLYGLIISQLIINDMYKKMDRVRLFVGDEFWSALQSQAARDFVISFSKTSRKYKFSMLLGTQLYDDWFTADERAGRIITGLASMYIFCGFKKDQVIADVLARLNLPRGMFNEMKRVGVQDGEDGSIVKKFSRFIMIADGKNGRQITTYRNILSPFEYQLYSSSKEDNAIVKYYVEEQHWDIYKTINHINEKKFIGDKGLIEYLTEGSHLEALEWAKGVES